MQEDFSLMPDKDKQQSACLNWENSSCLCFVASFTDKPLCGAEDFLFCCEYRSFSHISNHTQLTADKYHRDCHHIRRVCLWNTTISPCNKLETGVHNKLSGFLCPSSMHAHMRPPNHSSIQNPLIYVKLWDTWT